MAGEIVRRIIELGSTEIRTFRYSSQGDSITPICTIQRFPFTPKNWHGLTTMTTALTEALAAADLDLFHNEHGIENIVILPDSYIQMASHRVKVKADTDALSRDNLFGSLEYLLKRTESSGDYLLRCVPKETEIVWNSSGHEVDFREASILTSFQVTSVDKSVLSALLKTFNDIGLKIHDIESSSDGLDNYLVESNAQALLHIGFRQSHVYQREESGSVKITRTKIGGHHFTSDLRMALETGYGEAEKLKRRYGVSQTLDDEGHECRRYLLPRLEELVELIEMATNETTGQGSKVILTGGGSLLPGLRRYFRDHFLWEICHFEPSRIPHGFDFDASTDSIVLAAALNRSYHSSSSLWTKREKAQNWLKSLYRWVKEVS